MTGLIRQACLLCVIATLYGCASVDFDYPKLESHALTDTAETSLGNDFEGLAEQHPGESGFFTLADGIDALASRLLLAERAERSIDAQYYLIKDDIVSHAFIGVVLRAADRGVRVRLLVDDMFMSGADAAIVGLNSHPNFEIRVFNPFARRSARAVDALTSFSRINRRMHNKSFTADNQITIIGGRNIADEYFGARKDAKFGDLDVMSIGPVVQEVSNTFDAYWNHERAAPPEAFADIPDDPAGELERVRALLAESQENITNTKYAAAVRDKYLEYEETGNDVFEWAPYTLAVDSPDKNFKKEARTAASITTPLRESVLGARSEALIISPYFVPRKAGVETLIELQRSGVDVTIVTNSLAANNQSSVQAGYAPSRKPLLEGGVKIYEIRPDAEILGAELMAASGAKATLHTKAFIIDRREFFIGSFNFDPRSANINTELGVIIQSPEMSANGADLLMAALPSQAYEVFLNEKGKVRWRAYEDGEEVIYEKEPQTTWGQRFMAGFMRILPIRGQL